MEAQRGFSRVPDAVWIALAALLAISPLLLRGASCGHDLSFHLLNWMEVASQWKQGVLRPFWCYHAAWNAGEPRFVFYPPLSWMLGAALSLIFPAAWLPVAYMYVALLLCGLTMRKLLRQIVTPQTALLVSCLYLANPYALFTAFERSAFAELLAAAWMPLLLRAMLRKQMSVPALAIPVALLWLTNAPAAVAGSYALLIAGTLRSVLACRSAGWTAARSFALRTLSGYATGLALSSLFLLPAVVQRRWVQVSMAIAPGLRPADNFIFTHTGQPEHDLVLHQASMTAAAVLCLGLACFLVLVLSSKHHVSWHSMHDRQASLAQISMLPTKAMAAVLGALLLVILFLLTSASAPVWKYAPELAFLQFPWRLLAVGAAATAVLVALLLRNGRLPRIGCILAALLFALLAAWATRALYFQPCDDEDAPQNQQFLFQSRAGAEATDEYTPLAADNDALKRGLPEAWTTVREDDFPIAHQVLPRVGTSGERLNFSFLAPPNTNYLVVRLRQFYGWQVSVDGQSSAEASQRDDGLLAIPLTPGMHTVIVRYRWTWDEKLGLLLSLIAAGIIFVPDILKPLQLPPRAAGPGCDTAAIP